MNRSIYAMGDLMGAAPLPAPLPPSLLHLAGSGTPRNLVPIPSSPIVVGIPTSPVPIVDPGHAVNAVASAGGAILKPFPIKLPVGDVAPGLPKWAIPAGVAVAAAAGLFFFLKR